MLAVLQAEGAQPLQRRGHAQCSRIRETVAAVHIEVLQASGRCALAQCLYSQIRDALAILQNKSLQTSKYTSGKCCCEQKSRVLTRNQQG